MCSGTCCRLAVKQGQRSGSVPGVDNAADARWNDGFERGAEGNLRLLREEPGWHFLERGCCGTKPCRRDWNDEPWKSTTER